MAKRTITLSNRPPVTIEEDAWPIIAKAVDSEHDGQVECQANRKSAWGLRVRQHADGRCIIYAGYSYDTTYQGARSLAHKAGQVLPAKSTMEDICVAIKSIATTMEGVEHHGDDARYWARLADECIADLPAEDIDAAMLPGEEAEGRYQRVKDEIV